MSAKKAAPIIESRNENEAITILSNLKSDILAVVRKHESGCCGKVYNFINQ